ncbi:hypothetical protein JCM3770_000909 [Rhodotorula araucariae]
MAAYRLLPLFALVPSLASAAIQPTWPGGQGLVFRAGDTCSFRYDTDTTGTWKSFALDLMSGSDSEMVVKVIRVGSNLDGTVAGQNGAAEFNFTCPEVDPPAPIYFLEATQDDRDPVWTSRFTLAAPNGTVVPAPHSIQPDNGAIPWGVGAIVNGANAAATGSHLVDPISSSPGNSLNPFAQNSSSKPLDVPLLPTTASSAAETAIGGPGITGFQRGQACSKTAQCPESAPCCSEEGFCGSGRNCLAGCDPLASFKPAACAPVPACVSGEYQLNTWDANRILLNSSTWTGDATTYDWLVDKLGNPQLGPMTAAAETGAPSLTLSLTEEGKGTVLTSTRSVLYGNVTARIKSVAGSGILTSFSLLSGTGDEIDYEFTTNATDLAHTAYFHHGDVANYSSNEAVNITDRTVDFHNYTISWTPEAITWLVDGVALRNISKNSTASPSAPTEFRYPQTPSRIQFSIWAAGREGQPDGLVEFAGGPVDWTASNYIQNGYYASYISAINVECYDPSLLPELSPDASSPDSYAASAGLNASAEVPASGELAASPASLSADPASSTSTTAPPPWWTPPTVNTDAATTSATSSIVAPWLLPATRKLRRRLQLLEKVKRADPLGVGSYSYALGDNGVLSVAGGNAPTTIANDAATGFDMGGTGVPAPVLSVPIVSPPTGSSSLIPSTATSPTVATARSDLMSSSASATKSQASASPSAMGEVPTLQEKWEALGTPAHVGIYIGGAAAALFLVVLIGWLWRKAASARNGSKGTPPADAYGPYCPINDNGEMLPTGNIYSGTGEMHPGQDLYSGGQAPAAAAAPLRRSSTKSSTQSKYAAGAQGYVPSSQLKAQYDIGYQPQSMRQV